MEKKGMEMWQLVLMVLILIFMIAAIVLIGMWGGDIGEMFKGMGDLF